MSKGEPGCCVDVRMGMVSLDCGSRMRGASKGEDRAVGATLGGTAGIIVGARWTVVLPEERRNGLLACSDEDDDVLRGLCSRVS